MQISHMANNIGYMIRDENLFLQKNLKVRRVCRENKWDERHIIFDWFMDIT